MVVDPRPVLPTTFTALGVPRALADVLAANGVNTPYAIQAATLPDSLAGRDVLGRGRTGSGKTYAFLLPLVARLLEVGRRRSCDRPRSLVLAPTRELASQIDRALAPLAAATGLRHAVVFGGVSAATQIRAARSGLDVLVACPGRLEDLIRGGHIDLGHVEVTVLDEADHMADLGFLPAVQRILQRTPPGGQRLLFSATLDRGVDGLVRRFLHDPVTHIVDEPASAQRAMKHHVLQVHREERMAVLLDLLAAPGRSVVFTRTKHGAKRLARDLATAGIPAVELHGDLAQNARERNLQAFASGHARALVATDIAARGIHVDDVALVIHADPPVEHKSYLHRSGRTARAGATGTVVTLATHEQVADVQALTRRAAISPTSTRVGPGHPLLATIAPGKRMSVRGSKAGLSATTASAPVRRAPATPRLGAAAFSVAARPRRRRPA